LLYSEVYCTGYIRYPLTGGCFSCFHVYPSAGLQTYLNMNPGCSVHLYVNGADVRFKSLKPVKIKVWFNLKKLTEIHWAIVVQ